MPKADDAGPITEEEQQGNEREPRDARDEEHRAAPSARLGERGHRRDEHELPGRRRGAEEPDDEAALGAEPAVRDRRADDLAHRAGAEPQGDPVEKVELPELAHEGRREKSEAEQQAPDDEDASRAEAVDEGASERAAEAEGDDAHGDRERDAGPVPAELALQRRDEHARRAAHGRRDEEREEHDRGDDEGVMETEAHREKVYGLGQELALDAPTQLVAHLAVRLDAIRSRWILERPVQ